MTLKCDCGGNTRVIDTRGDGLTVYRMRECKKCKNRFVTVEYEENDPDNYYRLKKIANEESRNRLLGGLFNE